LVPDELPAAVDDCARSLGARGAVIYLVDLDQRVLVALGDTKPDELVIDSTFAGRAFRQIDLMQTNDEHGDVVLWVPMLDGTERLGVLRVLFPPGSMTDDFGEVRALAGLSAELVMVKLAYGDFFEKARRREPVTVGADLLWQLLPPLTFGTEDVVVSAVGRTAMTDPPPETMRRLMHAIVDHNEGPLRDDATAVMIEWRGSGSAQLARVR
jgi:hypothetical protein